VKDPSTDVQTAIRSICKSCTIHCIHQMNYVNSRKGGAIIDIVMPVAIIIKPSTRTPLSTTHYKC